MAKGASATSGRPRDARLAEAIATVCLLSTAGTSLSTASLQAALLVSTKRAEEILRALCGETAAGDATDGTAPQIQGETDAAADPILPLYASEGGGTFTRIDIEGGRRLLPLRLTQAQAKALERALDRLGIPQASGLRLSLRDAFWPRPPKASGDAETRDIPGVSKQGKAADGIPDFDGSPKEAVPGTAPTGIAEDGRGDNGTIGIDKTGNDKAGADGGNDSKDTGIGRNGNVCSNEGHNDGSDLGNGNPSRRGTTDTEPSSAAKALLTCAVSIARNAQTTQSVVTFGYRGDNDLLTRHRRVLPQSLRLADGRWVVDAYDLDARGTRTFLAERITNARLSAETASAPSDMSSEPDGGCVRLICRGIARDVVTSWQGARIVASQPGQVTVEVPYYRGDWLPRHVLALGRDVTHDSELLAGEMTEIARLDLALSAKLIG